MNEEFRYKVALSFAGDKREFVREVAACLKAWRVNYFFDEDAEARLIGEDALEIFPEIFGKESEYGVMFVSRDYIKKRFPTIERRVLSLRTIDEKPSRVILIRLDDTEVPKILETFIHMDGRHKTPAQIAVSIGKAIGVDFTAIKASDVPPPANPSLVGELYFDFSRCNGRHTIGKGECEFEIKVSAAGNTAIYIYNDPSSIKGIALASECHSILDIQNAKSFDDSSRTRIPKLNQIIVLSNQYGFYAAVQLLEIIPPKPGRAEEYVKFRYAIQPDRSDNFANLSLPWAE